jgi:hypothetical protein
MLTVLSAKDYNAGIPKPSATATAASALAEPSVGRVTFVSVHPGWNDTDMGSGKGARKPPLTTDVTSKGIVAVAENTPPSHTVGFVTWEGKPYEFGW